MTRYFGLSFYHSKNTFCKSSDEFGNLQKPFTQKGLLKINSSIEKSLHQN